MTKRLQQVNQLIKKELSRLVLREIDFPENVLVTVTRVKTSIDLNQAKVYVGVFPEEQRLKIIQILNNQIYHLQQKINKRLKMKIIPKIIFVEEKKTEEAGKVEELLEKIRNSNS